MDKFFMNFRTALGALAILAVVYYIAGTAVLLIAVLAMIQFPLYWLMKRQLCGVDGEPPSEELVQRSQIEENSNGA